MNKTILSITKGLNCTLSTFYIIASVQVVPGRMSLLVILFLVIINTFNAVK